MPDDAPLVPGASYRSMAEGTKEDYELVFEHFKRFERDLASRVLAALAQLQNSYPGELVNRLVHSLQTATRAHRDGRDEEYVVAALLHDLGDLLSTMNHSEYAASILKPYVRPNIHWMIRQHGLFQGYYYFHHFGTDRNARDRYRGHPAHQMCLDFCDRYDQAAFDPDYDTMPLAAFEPMVHRLFAREPWGAHAKLDGGYREQF
ncbi:MAG TPA: HD domain-containing protein [Acetobacteraceae bacterium]|nr:HD domain-containing protein [Acetobacteraceae bacterium]